VTTGVFDARHKRFIRHIHGFIDGEGVEVSPERDDGARPGALQKSDHAMVRNIGADLIQAERTETIGNDASRALFAIGEFGMAVEVAACFDEAGTEGGRGGGDAVVEFRCAEAQKAPKSDNQHPEKPQAPKFKCCAPRQLGSQGALEFGDWSFSGTCVFEFEIFALVHSCRMVLPFIERNLPMARNVIERQGAAG